MAGTRLGCIVVRLMRIGSVVGVAVGPIFRDCRVRIAAACCIALVSSAGAVEVPAKAAEEGGNWVVMLGGDPRLEPRSAGSRAFRPGGLPYVDIRRSDKPEKFSAPEDSLDATLIGNRLVEFGVVADLRGGRNSRSMPASSRMSGSCPTRFGFAWRSNRACAPGTASSRTFSSTRCIASAPSRCPAGRGSPSQTAPRTASNSGSRPARASPMERLRSGRRVVFDRRDSGSLSDMTGRPPGVPWYSSGSTGCSRMPPGARSRVGSVRRSSRRSGWGCTIRFG